MNEIPDSPPLMLTTFGQPEVSVSIPGHPPSRRTLPNDDWVLLLVSLAYFGERDAAGGAMDRLSVEAIWREARAKADRFSPSYDDYKASGAVRNATGQLRDFLGELLPRFSEGNLDFVQVPAKGKMRLNPALLQSDIGQYLQHARRALRAKLPDDAAALRQDIEAARRIYDNGMFLPGFEHRFGRLETVDENRRLTSWILDARRYLVRQQALLADRQLELTPFYFLPAYENSFVPRVDLQAEILQWLRGQDMTGSHSALVLHGGYGAGKTRLAIESIRTMGETEALARYTGGISFLPLDAYFSEPGAATGVALLRAIAERLRAPEPLQKAISTVPSGLEALQRWLELSRPRLLLLDNGESAFTRETSLVLLRLLQSADNRLRCLITSRTAYPDLRHLPVEAMVLPATTDDDFAAFAGSRVYLERVRQRDPAYRIPDPALLLTALRQTEGLPLNLELLAGRTWDLGERGLRALVEQEDPADLLTLEPEPAYFDGQRWRHHSASTSILRSLRLLSEEERHRFISLAVFPYDWDAAASEAICGVDERTLRRWRDSYLVAYNATEDRWLLRPRIREVAQELFIFWADRETITLAFQDYYLKASERIAAKLQTSEVKTAQTSFRNDRLNVETAFASTLLQMDQQSGENSLRLALAVKSYLLLNGYPVEALQALREALAHPGAKAITGVRIKALGDAVSTCANRLRDAPAGAPFYDELEASLFLYSGPECADARCSLAHYDVFQSKLDKAKENLDIAESLESFRSSPDNLCRIYTCRALIEFVTQNRQERLRWFIKAREQSELSGDVTRIALALSNLGQTAVDAELFHIAHQAILRGLKLSYDNDLRVNISYFLNVTGNYFYRCGEKCAGTRMLLMSDSFMDSLGAKRGPHEFIESYREEIGEEAFQREVSYVANWSLEQAVEFVLAIPPPAENAA